MRAAFIDATGAPEVIRIGDLPVPSIGPTDVLIRTVCASVNHVDTFVRSGAYVTPTPFPFVIGRDVVGIVVEASPGAEGFKPGDRVWSNSLGYGGRQGPTSEFCCVPSDRLWKLPAAADPIPSVALLHPLSTAYVGLVCRAKLSAYQTVFVTGGAGGVGGAVIQLAKQIGAHVITSCREEDRDYCISMGADHVVNFERSDWMRTLSELVPSIDVYWDNSGHTDYQDVGTVLAPGARVVVMSGIDHRPAFPQGMYYTRDISLIGFAISNASVAELTQAAAVINGAITDGSVSTRIAKILPLSQARQAHELMDSTRSGARLRGRLVIDLTGSGSD